MKMQYRVLMGAGFCAVFLGLAVFGVSFKIVTKTASVNAAANTEYNITLTSGYNNTGNPPAGGGWSVADQVCLVSNAANQCTVNSVLWQRPSSDSRNYVINNCVNPGAGYVSKTQRTVTISGSPYTQTFCLWENVGGAQSDLRLGHAGTGNSQQVNCATDINQPGVVSVFRPSGYTFGSRACSAVSGPNGPCVSDICLFTANTTNNNTQVTSQQGTGTATCSQNYEYATTSAANIHWDLNNTYTSSAVSCLNTMPAGGGWQFADSECLISSGANCVSQTCLWKRPSSQNFDYTLTHQGTDHNLPGINCANNPPAGYTLKSRGCQGNNPQGCITDVCLWEKPGNSNSSNAFLLSHQGAGAGGSVNCANSSPASGYNLNSRIGILSTGNCAAGACGPTYSDLCLWQNSQTCVAPTTPSVDLKINGQNGTINLPIGSAATLTWTSTGVQRCNTGTSAMTNNGWGNYIELATSGSHQFTVSSSGTFGIQCSVTQNSPMVVQDSVAVHATTPQTIACSTNAQCGTNGLTGGLFCSNGDSYQKFRTYVCNNPGTAASSCSHTDADQLQNNCTTNQTCSASTGMCVNNQAQQPTVQTNAATSISTNSATLNGNLTDLGGASSADVWFEYGTTTSYGSTTNHQTKNSTGTFNRNITGLAANTTYHFRAVAQNSAGSDQGNDLTFSTGTATSNLTVSCNTSPSNPQINQQVTFAATPSGGTGSYTYSWTGNCTGSSQNCYHTFSNSGNYTATVTVTSGNQTQSDSCTVTVSGTNVSDPSVATNAATNVSTNSATLNGNLTGLGGASSADVWFEYGTSTSYGSTTNHQTKTSTGTFSRSITGLAANTTYHFRAVAQNSAGNDQGNDMTFTTGTGVSDPSVATTSATNIQETSATLNGNLDSLGGASSASVWFQWGTNTSYGNTTATQTRSSTGSFAQTITGLNQNTTYHFRAVAQNSAGTDYGSDMTFTTTSTNNGGGTIICSNNSDCQGTTYGSLYCGNNNGIYRSQTTYSCINAATTSSYCQPNTTQQFQNSCNGNQTCSGGSCTNNTNTCTQNSYQSCVGNGKYWFDSCGVQGSYIGSCYVNTCTQNATYRCVGNGVYWFDSCGVQGGLYQACTGNQTCSGNTCVNQNTYGNLNVTTQVRNLSTGNLNWSSTVNASPSDILQFQITLQNTSSQYINNVLVRDTLPANLIYNNNLTVDGTANGGSIISGVNIGNISPNQTRIVTYQVQVAPAQNFVFGTTSLNDSVSVTADNGNASNSSASVVVTRSGVLGATSVSTGPLTGNFLVDSFLLPLVLAFAGVWAYKAGLLNNLAVVGWVNKKKVQAAQSMTQRKLENKIAEIKQKETI